jgi:diadenosine tetraphosphate (Ap4A) HIT family hydrolase
LIVPKRHVADYFELTFEEQKDLVQLSAFVQKRIKADFQPDGFTTGMNIGKSAGQKFPHASLHLIPRYAGDCKNPSGGIRNILR